MRELLVQSRIEQSRQLLGDETAQVLQRVIDDSVQVLEDAGFGCTAPYFRDDLTGELIEATPELLLARIFASRKDLRE